MGFENGFDFSIGTRRDRIRLLGNGVCPPVMEAVVRSLVGRGLNDASCPGTACVPEIERCGHGRSCEVDQNADYGAMVRVS